MLLFYIFLLLLICIVSPSFSVKLDVFSSITIYEWAHGDAMKRTVALKSGSTVDYANSECTAIHVHGVIRHGTRNPNVGPIENINALYRKLLINKNATSFPDMASLQTDHVYKMETAGDMIGRGIEEMRGLARRFGTMFSQLFEKNGIQFVSSRIKRNRESADAFYDGFKDVINDVTDYENLIDDVTMRFYEDCYNYEHAVKENQANFVQYKKYDTTPEFQAVVNSVTSKLELKTPVLSEDLYTMYDLCAYEMYVYNDTRWCDLMSDEDRGIMEYGKDLQKYYMRSYGHPMNSLMACPLLRDIFQTLDSAIENTYNYSGSGLFMHTKDYLSGKFQIGHFETHVFLLTALGLFKDADHLLATNRVAMANREFRSSRIAPYSANVVFALYACDYANVTMVMRILVNEESVVIPACGEKLCPYQQVKTHYMEQLKQCDLKKMCGTKSNGNPSVTCCLLLMMTCLFTCMWCVTGKWVL